MQLPSSETSISSETAAIFTYITSGPALLSAKNEDALIEKFSEYYDQAENATERAALYNDLAVTYALLKNHEAALSYFKIALKFNPKDDETQVNASIALLEAAKSAAQAKNYPKSHQLTQEALEILAGLKDRSLENNDYKGLAILCDIYKHYRQLPLAKTCYVITDKNAEETLYKKAYQQKEDTSQDWSNRRAHIIHTLYTKTLEIKKWREFKVPSKKSVTSSGSEATATRSPEQRTSGNRVSSHALEYTSEEGWKGFPKQGTTPRNLGIAGHAPPSKIEDPSAVSAAKVLKKKAISLLKKGTFFSPAPIPPSVSKALEDKAQRKKLREEKNQGKTKKEICYAAVNRMF